MGLISRTVFAVVPTGIGRPDFSQNIEVAVESQIRSYQQQHHDYRAISIPAGGSTQVVIPLPSGFVVMMYDFYLSAPVATLLGLDVESPLATGVMAYVFRKYGYTLVAENIERGFPIFQTYTITAYNYGPDDVVAFFSAHGLQTDETQYYGRLAA